MARCLIIGCGCRGRMLARSLISQGHAVRGTTRHPEVTSEIEAAGAEAMVGDPDRLGSLVGALEHVSVALILLGCARGTAGSLADLHGPRLKALLTRMVDTTIHGVVYEGRGTVDPELLRAGAAQVRGFGERSRARVEVLDADPADPDAWLRGALAAIDAVLGPG